MDHQYHEAGKILDFLINEENDKITFVCQDKNIIFRACAECCSHSWFEYNEDDVENCIGKYVQDLENDEESKIEHDAFDCLRIEPWTINFTDNTTFNFKLLNESNGYYSGHLDIQIVGK